MLTEQCFLNFWILILLTETSALMSKSLRDLKFSDLWRYMLMSPSPSPSSDHFYENQSYVYEKLRIVAIGKANFHCFIKTEKL